MTQCLHNIKPIPTSMDWDPRTEQRTETTDDKPPWEQHSDVHVSGLPPDFDEARLRALFALHGEVASCRVVTDNLGASKGFGFVVF